MGSFYTENIFKGKKIAGFGLNKVKLNSVVK
ncbi:Uncharacterised protein [Streptococcus pneumoniae]|nr:Uncharacterised protein [Streptococcus pneumoniae]CGF90770.1 Uncharacterised protein [Streptococcus pneumoniae]CJA50740.1 Uncharacterised protein [Streptococcus pneumoniae]CJA73998.1 Uncharacterised protein [Streptococcus pneumoniae]CJB41764.1 Uncharacterised protein [Streptococcus pneumoniae]